MNDQDEKILDLHTSEPLRTSIPKVAVIIPCLNEERTVGGVIRDFRAVLPEAEIWVFDNNSTDGTVREAEAAGAKIGREMRRGKGFVLQSMFQEVEADVYLMVDGDGTYPAHFARGLIAPVVAGHADMVIGSRLDARSRSKFAPVNRLGNRLFLAVLNAIFREGITDLLSGYRAFSRDFVKNAPLVTGGFQIETEMTIKALERGYRVVEVPIDLQQRPEGSQSKVRILRDGVRIMGTIFALFRDFKPLTFFGGIGAVLILAGFVPGTVVIIEYIETGLVPKLPSAVLAVGLVLSGILSCVAGLILHVITRRVMELEILLRMWRRGLEKGGNRDRLTS